VQKYGPTVLAAPSAQGFNRVAWIMPFAVLLLGILGTMMLVRNWKLDAILYCPRCHVGLHLTVHALPKIDQYLVGGVQVD